MSTPNLGIPTYGSSWLDQHPGLGLSEMVTEALTAVDAALSSGITVIKETTVISSEALLAAKAAPVQVLPPIDGDSITQPLFAVLRYQTDTTDYTLGDATQIFIGPQGSPMSNYVLQPCAATVLDGSNTSPVVGVMPAVNAVVGEQVIFANLPLVLTHNGSAELADGDGSLTVVLHYMVIEL